DRGVDAGGRGRHDREAVGPALLAQRAGCVVGVDLDLAQHAPAASAPQDRPNPASIIARRSVTSSSTTAASRSSKPAGNTTIGRSGRPRAAAADRATGSNGAVTTTTVGTP